LLLVPLHLLPGEVTIGCCCAYPVGDCCCYIVVIVVVVTSVVRVVSWNVNAFVTIPVRILAYRCLFPMLRTLRVALLLRLQAHGCWLLLILTVLIRLN